MQETHKPTKTDASTVRITVDIPKPLHKHLRHQVADEEITIRELMLRLLKRYLDEQQRGR